ncbi:replication restart helicase PriA [Flavobacterium silvaticum]|uniref:Replication restart protein PriA n=1 Tax=Flavobacterium silvaticum TaxID=1852020 RepID=A0A972JJA1_9FLAO|nr:primosomal protein N' [Flavobacterium silvaticum]NMH29143.1 primosomal protein N' [Flavobacterium silvaticum]
MPAFVEVILPLNLNKTFTYEVSEHDARRIVPGMRLAVPFGKNKIYTALAIELHSNAPTLYEAKPIDQILDETPTVTPEQIEHWKWIASYYMCAIGDVYRSAMPSGLLLESETLIRLNPDVLPETMELDSDEAAVIEALKKQSSIKIQEVLTILGKKTVFPVIKKMMAKKLVSLEEIVSENYKPKLKRYIRLFPEFENGDNLEMLLELLKNAPKQKDILLQYFQLKASERQAIPVTRLLEESGASAVQLKSLIEKEIFEEYYLQRDRVDFSDRQENRDLQLSPAQDEAFESILESFKSHDVSLMHGVTSSGKTEVYIKIIERVIESGSQVLYLLPEIVLTAQLVMRLTAHFGNKVAVYHSRYTSNERIEVWNQILESSEKAQVVIGARSALFLPFKSLGLIIIDEEHEQTFKQQDPAPRYHARDASIVLATYFGAKVLLGSATPSIESYFNAKSGKFGLVELSERYGNATLPEVSVIDLKDSYFRKKMTGHFSQELIEGIKSALDAKEQVILFQNRRGYSPVLECMSCGHVPHCTQCDVSLTYHKAKGQLRCHYCGSSMAFPTHCHACHSPELQTKGFGTEQIELELKEIFPSAKTARMDQDTTRGKFAFEKLIHEFRERDIDILVGTQMLAKGLDFDNVSLVGIMNADTMLYHPDFRALERSFQMMTQVAGRAGRSQKQGKVLIQTYNPTHTIVRQVTANDYVPMYRDQLHERHIYHYPPYARLLRLTFRHRDYDKVKEAAQWTANVLRQQINIPVLGPEEPTVARIRNEYIRNILIKIPQETPLSGTKKTIQRILDSFESISQFRPVKVTVNVDFY